MKVLYGVASEGMGHATRSSVVVDHLLARGHDVRIASSAQALTYLDRLYPGRTFPITGLVIERDHQQSVSAPLTLLSNMVRQVVGAVADLPNFFSTAGWSPDIIFSDFDPWSARTAHVLSRPLVAIDNIQFYARCRHPKEVLSAVATTDLGLGLTVTDAMVPGARSYLVPSVFPAQSAYPNTFVFPPALRRSVLAHRRQKRAPRGEHVTVYLKDADHYHYAFVGTRAPVRIWGSNTTHDPHPSHGVTYHTFDEDDFLRDLATARACVIGAGHSTISEAAHLGTPMLTVPVFGQYEQVLNAAYVERLGYGERADHVTLTAHRIQTFLQSAPAYKARLEDLWHDENVALLLAVDREIARAA